MTSTSNAVFVFSCAFGFKNYASFEGASSAWYMRNDLQVFPHLYFRIDDIAFDNGGNVFFAAI